MKLEASHTYEKVILGIEVAGFCCLLAVLWLDEYLDVPFRFMGALKTPLRPQEFWFEATATVLVAIVVITATLWVFRRLRILESFIQVCGWCRKVNVDDEWVPFEEYLRCEHEVLATHGICPTCRANAAKPRAKAEAAGVSA